MRSFISLLMLCLLVVGCDNAPKKNGSESSPSGQGQKSQSNIIDSLSDEIVEDANNPNLYIKRALEYKNQQLFKLATRDVERALSIDSTVSYFHGVKGEVYFASGQLRNARLSLEDAVRLDETNTEALLKLAEVNFLLRRYDQALTALNDALRENERLANAYFIKGFIYKELGDTTLSKSSFQTAVEVDPDMYKAYIELGNMYGYEGDPLAVDYFNTALEMKPKSAEAYYGKGMYHQQKGEFDEAINTYRDLINATDDNFLGYYNTGYIYLTQTTSYDTAIAYFDTVLTIQPAYIDAMHNKGVAYEEMGEDGNAIEIYRKVLEADPQYDQSAKGLERLVEGGN